MIVVAGPDNTQRRSLKQMVESLRRHEPDVSLVVYDLGPTAGQRRRLIFPRGTPPPVKRALFFLR